jgi:hypothetical protein
MNIKHHLNHLVKKSETLIVKSLSFELNSCEAFQLKELSRINETSSTQNNNHVRRYKIYDNALSIQKNVS